MAFILKEFEALGTKWWIEVFDVLPEQSIEKIQTELTVVMVNFEARYSRFRKDSLVSRLNTDRVLNNPDQSFVQLLQYGCSLYQQTNGKFNILVGDELIARGYDADYSFLPKVSPDKVSNPTVDLKITEDKIVLDSGSIDFGGFGKGYLIDLLAKRMKDLGLLSFLINGGGDIYVTNENGRAVDIQLQHPTSPETFVGTTSLLDQGFAASSPHQRKWKVNGKTHNHIVGRSDDAIIDGVFIKAKDTALADAFATTALLLNEEQMNAFAKEHDVMLAYVKKGRSKLVCINGFC